ncbi:MAG: tryptophan 7-halogenase [Cellvibrionaceae bacterium]|nr:tryptophan 7-halogenase [Cellvibrionaceae bacterium]
MTAANNPASSATDSTAKNADVIITGGGLAGLSLAKQLLDAMPELKLVIVEHRQFPLPPTTAKIGESTVEIGSHYFTQVLGLDEHFQQHHLRKQGLRCFFGKPQADYAQQDELGVSRLFGIATYQIERGVLENYLYAHLSAAGVKIIDGARTEHIDLGNKQHRITLNSTAGEQGCGEQHFSAPWLIDASGRQALLKNKLGLNKPNTHRGNAVWFRIDRKIVIDQWTDDNSWQTRVEEQGKRWLSTNHLMGAGYWVWIIPLGSGATSIGIVMDDQAMADSHITCFDDTLAWLQQQQPRCAAAIAGAGVLDFAVVQDYSYGCSKMFSEQGWALTGEAGAFTDPFYAPGSDFIAFNNTFITHLIQRDRQGKDIRLDSAVFHIFYNSFFENTLSLYTHQYGGFGDRRMMSVKLLWDYAYYWGVLTLLFFTQAITDIDLMRQLNPKLLKAQQLNALMQEQLIKRARKRLVLPAKGLFLDQYPIPCLQHFIAGLNTDPANTGAIDATLTENIAMMEAIHPYLIEMLDEGAVKQISACEHELLGDYRLQILA